MALVAAGDALRQLTFGHPSPRAAHAALEITASADEATPIKAIANLIRRLQAFAGGEAVDFSDVPLDPPAGTRFARNVIDHCRRIPFGGTLTYAQLAARAGSPRAARAVGNAMRTNRCPLVVPCHRVVAGNGAGGYSAAGGVRTKLRLLEQEAQRKR